jgi:hypothetical protein
MVVEISMVSVIKRFVDPRQHLSPGARARANQSIPLDDGGVA